MEKKMKHLEYIQAVITRMNANSFMLKGWTVTLVVALFALDISKTSVSFIKISFLPAILFWVLDGYFLYQERLFRDLYDEVRNKDESQVDFSMKRASNIWKFIDAALSKTLTLFYGVLIITITFILCRGGF